MVKDLGDKLLSQGKVIDAHFCYMVGGCNVEPPVANSRLVLVGCDHTANNNNALLSNESILAFQRTEAFEWAKRKGNSNACIPSLQVSERAKMRAKTKKKNGKNNEERSLLRLVASQRVFMLRLVASLQNALRCSLSMCAPLCSLRSKS